MESPPSSSSWSQPFILSDDSGLLLTTGSLSSGSTSFESKSGRKHFQFEDSDCEEKSLSQDDSLDGMSDIMCGEHFNTLKKGPHWTDIKQSASPIEPPLEFQDRPNDMEASPVIEFFCTKLTSQILHRALLDFRDEGVFKMRCDSPRNIKELSPVSPPPLPSRTSQYHCPPVRPLPELPRNFTRIEATLSRSSSYLCYASPYRSLARSHFKQNTSFPSPTSNFASSAANFASSASPYVSHTPRPSSRSSLGGSSRLSSSHNSLSIPHARRVDDSSFITQAVSHDTLSSNQISDIYTVPFDSDVYAVPVDEVKKPTVKLKRGGAYSNLRMASNLFSMETKKRHRNSTTLVEKGSRSQQKSGRKSVTKSEQHQWIFQSKTKRHSVAGTSAGTEPIHMTLQEVRNYLQTLHSSSSDSSETRENNYRKKNSTCRSEEFFAVPNNNNNNNNKYPRSILCIGNNQVSTRSKKSTFLINLKNKKVKDSCDNAKTLTISPAKKEEKKKKIFNFKQALCNIFRFRRFLSVEEKSADKLESDKLHVEIGHNVEDLRTSLSGRALPPLPQKEEELLGSDVEQALDFATSIQRVKDYGWYWGPISSEAAEKILSNEPDGSFIVRDSSDDHYIFSLTFKLNNSIRHVRIEHDQGNFSFGSCTKFKSQTIVEFIENAVEHSRSGRYLFFLHRRPVIGPVRVQLLHPVSRFKQVQSLQHMCRFVIHKNVRRDLIPELPLPRRMIDYLNTPHYYSEHLTDVGEGGDGGGEDSADEHRSHSSGDNTLRTSCFLPPVARGAPRDDASTNHGNGTAIRRPHTVPVNEYIVFNGARGN